MKIKFFLIAIAFIGCKEGMKPTVPIKQNIAKSDTVRHDTASTHLTTSIDSTLKAWEYRDKATDLMSQVEANKIHWQYTGEEEYKKKVISLRKRIAKYYDSSYMYDRNEECLKVAASWRTKLTFSQ